MLLLLVPIKITVTGSALAWPGYSAIYLWHSEAGHSLPPASYEMTLITNIIAPGTDQANTGQKRKCREYFTV